MVFRDGEVPGKSQPEITVSVHEFDAPVLINMPASDSKKEVKATK